MVEDSGEREAVYVDTMLRFEFVFKMALVEHIAFRVLY
jgi:hypothetical protein